MFACWSVKGGSGTTVVSAALALSLGSRRPQGVLLVDLAGDLPAALGAAEPSGPGVAEWLGSQGDVPADALVRLESPVGEHVRLLHRGDAPFPAGAPVDLLAALLGGDPRAVVVDCGTLLHDGAELPLAIAACATHSLLVVRPCYLALRRAQRAPVQPSRLIVVTEPGRALGTADVEAVLGVPVLADIPLDPAVARAVDAGLLASRLPRSVARALREAA